MAKQNAPGAAKPGDGAACLGMLYSHYIADFCMFACLSAPPTIDGCPDLRHLKPSPVSEKADESSNSKKLTADLCGYVFDPTHESTHPAGTPLVADKRGNHGNNKEVNVLYLDGHVKWFADPSQAGNAGDDIYQPGYQGTDPKAAADYRTHSYLIP